MENLIKHEKELREALTKIQKFFKESSEGIDRSLVILTLRITESENSGNRIFLLTVDKNQVGLVKGDGIGQLKKLYNNLKSYGSKGVR